MPYIPQKDREMLDIYINNIVALLLEDKEKLSGKFNYVITKIAKDLFRKSNGLELRYNNLNNIVGVLESAKLELYRKLISAYEDVKIEQNGDV